MVFSGVIGLFELWVYMVTHQYTFKALIYYYKAIESARLQYNLTRYVCEKAMNYTMEFTNILVGQCIYTYIRDVRKVIDIV